MTHSSADSTGSQQIRPGAMLLITVLITGAVALAIGLGIALQSIGMLDMGTAELRAQEVLATADACMEEALLRTSRDASYEGESLPLERGSCHITVTGSGSQRTINVTASLGRWTRKITSQVSLSGSQVTLLEWQQNLN